VDGRKMKAALVSRTATTVQLRRADGAVGSVEIAQLSPADQTYLGNETSRVTAGNGAGALCCSGGPVPKASSDQPGFLRIAMDRDAGLILDMMFDQVHGSGSVYDVGYALANNRLSIHVLGDENSVPSVLSSHKRLGVSPTKRVTHALEMFNIRPVTLNSDPHDIDVMKIDLSPRSYNSRCNAYGDILVYVDGQKGRNGMCWIYYFELLLCCSNTLESAPLLRFDTAPGFTLRQMPGDERRGVMDIRTKMAQQGLSLHDCHLLRGGDPLMPLHVTVLSSDGASVQAEDVKARMRSHCITITAPQGDYLTVVQGDLGPLWGTVATTNRMSVERVKRPDGDWVTLSFSPPDPPAVATDTRPHMAQSPR